jgi:hypothetical protein
MPHGFKGLAEKLKLPSKTNSIQRYVRNMQTLSIVLTLISAAILLAPVGAVVIIYHDDLSQLVIPPEVRDILEGNSTLIPMGGGNSGLEELFNPVVESVEVNEQARTCTVTLKITNGLDYELTVKGINATVEVTQNHYSAGTISLGSPVTLPAGATAQLIMSGFWTQDAQNYITDNYPGATSIDAYLAYTTIDVNGIIVQMNEPIELGEIHLDVSVN